jgi:hypothetical protein
MNLVQRWRRNAKLARLDPQLDFVQAQTRIGWLTLCLLLAAFAVAISAWREYGIWMEREAETVVVENRAHALLTEKERQRRTVLHAPEHKLQEAVFVQKRNPLPLLDVVAQAWDADVALLNMQVDTQNKTVDVMLEARDLASGFAFLQRLSSQPGMTVNLSQNIQKENDPFKPVVLKLKAGLP